MLATLIHPLYLYPLTFLIPFFQLLLVLPISLVLLLRLLFPSLQFPALCLFIVFPMYYHFIPTETHRTSFDRNRSLTLPRTPYQTHDHFKTHHERSRRHHRVSYPYLWQLEQHLDLDQPPQAHAATSTTLAKYCKPFTPTDNPTAT
jgi:hypothetical protein